MKGQGENMIKKAAEFARIAHEGAFRKGSRIPYIYHPMEVALLVAGMTRDGILDCKKGDSESFLAVSTVF